MGTKDDGRGRGGRACRTGRAGEKNYHSYIATAHESSFLITGNSSRNSCRTENPLVNSPAVTDIDPAASQRRQPLTIRVFHLQH